MVKFLFFWGGEGTGQLAQCNIYDACGIVMLM